MWALLHVHMHVTHVCFFVLQENLRQLCVFKLANESSVPWKWWEYVTKFGEQCKMSSNQYNEECAERVRPRRPSTSC